MYISRRRRCIGPFAFGEFGLMAASERGRPNGLEGEKGRRVAASESRPVTYCKEENGVVSAEDGRETDLRIPPRSHRHCRGRRRRRR